LAIAATSCWGLGLWRSSGCCSSRRPLELAAEEGTAPLRAVGSGAGVPLQPRPEERRRACWPCAVSASGNLAAMSEAAAALRAGRHRPARRPSPPCAPAVTGVSWVAKRRRAARSLVLGRCLRRGAPGGRLVAEGDRSRAAYAVCLAGRIGGRAARWACHDAVID
jgi:hypothetical protein